jgi:hypothetical protein
MVELVAKVPHPPYVLCIVLIRLGLACSVMQRYDSMGDIGRYYSGFSYRSNRRGEQLQMLDGTLKNLLRGETLSYKKLTHT